MLLLQQTNLKHIYLFAVRAGYLMGVLNSFCRKHVFVSLSPLTILLIMPLILVDHAHGHKDLNVFKEPLAVGKAVLRVNGVVEKPGKAGRTQILKPGDCPVDPGYVSNSGNEDLLARMSRKAYDAGYKKAARGRRWGDSSRRG